MRKEDKSLFAIITASLVAVGASVSVVLPEDVEQNIRIDALELCAFFVSSS